MLFIIGFIIIVIIVYVILFVKVVDIRDNVLLCYFVVCFVCVGFYFILFGVNIWIVINLVGLMKKVQGVVFMIGLGNIGGIIGLYMFIESEVLQYLIGYGFLFGFGVMGIVVVFVLEWGFQWVNKVKVKMFEIEIREKYNVEEFVFMGDCLLLFKYYFQFVVFREVVVQVFYRVIE